MHGTGRRAGRDADRGAHHRGGAVGRGHPLVPLRHRDMQRQPVEFLIFVAVAHIHRDRRGERDHRAFRPKGIGERAGHVGHARPALAIDEARLAADPRIAVSRIDRGALATAIDDLDLGILERVPELVVAAHQAEEFFGAIGLRGLRDDFRNGCHSFPPIVAAGRAA